MSGIVAQNVGRNSGLIKAAAASGEWTLISTLTSDDSDADLSITSGIDSTYDVYCLKLFNIHAETDTAEARFNLSDDGGSSYDVTKTTSAFYGTHKESGTDAELLYEGGGDLAQGTGTQRMTLATTIGADADQSLSAEFYLFAPSSTTFVKHFLYRGQHSGASDYCTNTFVSGYANTTNAVDAIQFSMASGEIQGGSISLYGIG